jgi:type IV pilus assembly protein PilB
MSKQLEVVLRHSGLMTADQLLRSHDQARRGGVPLLDVILQDGVVTEEALADAFAKYLRLPRVRIASSVSDPEAIAKVSDKLVRKYACLPLAIDGKTLVLAMANPTDYQAMRDIEFASGLSIRPVVASRTELMDGIDQRYETEDRVALFLANVPDASDMQIVSEDNQNLDVNVADERHAAEVAPVVKMVSLVVSEAIKAGASDVHIEATLNDVNVRMRVDGVLRDYTHVPKWLHGPLISRLKVLAKLDIAERRLPQDGRINVHYQGRSIDIRVSTLPTHFGEKAVLRVLGSGSTPDINKLGLNAAQFEILDTAIKQPQGMILVTGPTGSGKSTTLYALLAHRKSPEVNIVTVEDPIEYQLAGVNQVQVNAKAGLSFAGVLRSILRQDPDVILVGEMRDAETSEVAFQAAMTGHLVLSTLHTNSAVAAVARLYDLDIDSSILSTTLTLVIAQRLVRRICEQCKEAYTPDAATAQRIGLGPDDGPIYRGRGCPACSGTGFAGRLGLYEFFRPTVTVRKLMHDKVGEVELRAAARQSGMTVLREDALDKIRQGLTSPDEVLRVVQVEESEIPCTNCHALIEPEFSVCPYCLFTIRKTCGSCGQNLKPGWKACPYCNEKALIQPLAADLNATEDAAFTPALLGPVGPRQAHPGKGTGARGEKRAREKGDNWPPGLRVVDFDTVPARKDVGEEIDAAATGSAEVAAAPQAVDQPPRTLRVMVVDDDEDIRQVVSFTLRKLPMRVEVVQAFDGQDAVEKADAVPLDLIVLDVMMPRMNGFETCERLRQSVRTAFVPILMLTASADEASRTKGYLVGTDDYMSKPFLPPDLNLRVTRLLRRTYGM